VKPHHERLEILRKAATEWLTPEATELADDALKDLADQDYDLIECYGIAPAKRDTPDGKACWFVVKETGVASIDMKPNSAGARDVEYEFLALLDEVRADEAILGISFPMSRDGMLPSNHAYYFSSHDLWLWASRLVSSRFQAYKLWSDEMDAKTRSLGI